MSGDEDVIRQYVEERGWGVEAYEEADDEIRVVVIEKKKWRPTARTVFRTRKGKILFLTADEREELSYGLHMSVGLERVLRSGFSESVTEKQESLRDEVDWEHLDLPERPNYPDIVYIVGLRIYYKAGREKLHGKFVKLAESVIERHSWEWSRFVNFKFTDKLAYGHWHKALYNEGVLERKPREGSTKHYYRFRTEGVEWMKRFFPNYSEPIS